MKPRMEKHFAEYQAYHRDPVNVAIHKVAVPAIFFHIVAMLDWVHVGVSVAGQEVTLGVFAVAMASLWYVVAAPRYAVLIVPFAVLCVWLGRMTPGVVIVAIAVVAWIAQLVGHARYEKRAPAFTDNLVQLLVGPAYVVALLLGDWPPSEDRNSSVG